MSTPKDSTPGTWSEWTDQGLYIGCTSWGSARTTARTATITTQRRPWNYCKNCHHQLHKEDLGITARIATISCIKKTLELLQELPPSAAQRRPWNYCKNCHHQLHKEDLGITARIATITTQRRPWNYCKNCHNQLHKEDLGITARIATISCTKKTLELLQELPQSAA